MNEKIDLYLRIKNDFQHLIQTGAYLEGEALPSVRKVALDIGVNPNTVMKSYQLLEADGFIEIIPKKGAYVKSHKSLPTRDFSTLDPIINTLKKTHNDDEIIEYIKILLGGNKHD